MLIASNVVSFASDFSVIFNINTPKNVNDIYFIAYF
jgi:hypothetical protein